MRGESAEAVLFSVDLNSEQTVWQNSPEDRHGIMQATVWTAKIPSQKRHELAVSVASVQELRYEKIHLSFPLLSFC